MNEALQQLSGVAAPFRRRKVFQVNDQRIRTGIQHTLMGGAVGAWTKKPCTTKIRIRHQGKHSIRSLIKIAH
jgi:hypothetical protein